MSDISDPIRRVEYLRFENTKKVKPKNPKEETQHEKFKDVLKNYEEAPGEEGGGEKKQNQSQESVPGRNQKISPLEALGGQAAISSINWVETPSEEDDNEKGKGTIVDKKA